MYIKYISNCNRTAFLKVLFIIFFAIFCPTSFSQITNGNVNPEETADTTKKVKTDKVKVEKVFSKDSLTGTNLYITGLFQYAFRTFEDESSNGFYKEWENQTSGYNSCVNIGLIMELSKHFHLDIGISYFGNSEHNTYQDSLTDSSYTYKNTYMQAAVPLRLRFVYGEKLQFFAFAGIAPLNILNIRYQSSYTTADSIAVTRELDIQKDGFASFNLMFTGGFGICYNVRSVGFMIYPEIRRHLINTYSNKTLPMTHKMYGIGVNAGLVFHF